MLWVGGWVTRQQEVNNGLMRGKEAFLKVTLRNPGPVLDVQPLQLQLWEELLERLIIVHAQPHGPVQRMPGQQACYVAQLQLQRGVVGLLKDNATAGSTHGEPGQA